MKRISFLLVVCLAMPLAGCQPVTTDAQGSAVNAADNTQISAPILTSTAPEVNGEVVEITEALFVSQLNDVYLNLDDYVGKTIKFEGMFMQYTWEIMGMTYYVVYRDSPGCCGNDGQAGFEVIWPEGSNKGYPNDNDWCEVVGRLETYEENGFTYPRIVLDTLTVKQERGAEFVSL